MLLYGNDMDDTTSVLEADLGRICKLEKGNFIGREELLRQFKSGVNRILTGFEMMDRGIARDQCPIEINGKRVGIVTSGSPAPFLKKNIGLAYLPVAYATVGTDMDIIIREKSVKARVVPTPFYRRAPSK
jgi:aminomethyltransferase